MKKFLFLISFSLFLFSCSNDNEEVPETTPTEPLMYPDVSFSTAALDKENIFIAYDSTKWFSKTRAMSPSIKVSGITSKQWISESKVYLDKRHGWKDVRLVSYAYFSRGYYYHREVQIPKGSSIILPPPDVMTANPMGFNPITGKGIGYSATFFKTVGDFDVYRLSTYVEEVTHDLSGRLVFIPPIYNPQTFISYKSEADAQSKIIFTYKYTDNSDW